MPFSYTLLGDGVDSLSESGLLTGCIVLGLQTIGYCLVQKEIGIVICTLGSLCILGFNSSQNLLDGRLDFCFLAGIGSLSLRIGNCALLLGLDVCHGKHLLSLKRQDYSKGEINLQRKQRRLYNAQESRRNPVIMNIKEIRTVFFGTPEFAEKILEALIQDGYNLVGVVCQPDRPVGRKHRLEPTPVHAKAEECRIPVVAPEKLRAEEDAVLALNPELIVTCAYGQIVPEDILKAPKYGCVNIHPSLLPKYRGGAPIQHAVWSGDSETGVCLMEMTKGMDSGRVWARTIVPIGPDETTEELTPRLIEVSIALLRENLPLYLEGKLAGEVQDETKVTIARNISREEEQVFFQKEAAQELYNHIRALIAWPTPYAMIEGKRMRFYKARLELKETKAAPGTVLGFANGAMEVAAIGGIIRIYSLQPEGKKQMDAMAFANGNGRSLIGKQFD